jgi:hypothetical protein
MTLNGSARKVESKPVEGKRVSIDHADGMILVKGEGELHADPTTTDNNDIHQILQG